MNYFIVCLKTMTQEDLRKDMIKPPIDHRNFYSFTTEEEALSFLTESRVNVIAGVYYPSRLKQGYIINKIDETGQFLPYTQLNVTERTLLQDEANQKIANRSNIIIPFVVIPLAIVVFALIYIVIH